MASFFVHTGLPVTLGQLGLPPEATGAATPVIADRATMAGETIHNMPFPVDAAAVAAAIAVADDLGRRTLASGG